MIKFSLHEFCVEICMLLDPISNKLIELIFFGTKVRGYNAPHFWHLYNSKSNKDISDYCQKFKLSRPLCEPINQVYFRISK